MPDKTELELLLYAELGEWFDKYSRWHLHSKEHQTLASRMAGAVDRLYAHQYRRGYKTGHAAAQRSETVGEDEL